MTPMQMKYFDAVCRFQSISRAAEELHVTQPTITVALQTLEKEIGINLFQRKGKKLLLTQEGTIIWNKVTPILTNIEKLEQDIKDIAHNKNHIRLAVPLQIGVQLLPKLFGEFRKLHPEIELEISETGGIDALQSIGKEELDLAITNYDNNFSQGLNYQKIGNSEICFCTYKTNPLAQKEYITIDDIIQEELVLLGGGFFINRVINKAFQDSGHSPKVLLYTTKLHTIKSLVKNGLASTFLMRQAILPEDGLVVLSLRPSYIINSGIVTKKGRQIYSDERTLIEYLKKSYSQQIDKHQ